METQMTSRAAHMVGGAAMVEERKGGTKQGRRGSCEGGEGSALCFRG
jgi:hypothetical protein